MKKMIAAMALMMSAPLFAADVQELNANDATSIVVVKQILANDANGEPRILFNDNAGAMMKVEDLAQIDNILNASNIEGIGEYGNLHVVLDEQAFIVGQQVEMVSLDQGLGGTVVKLDGRLQVSKNFVGTDTDFNMVDIPTRYAARDAGERENS